MWRAAKPIQAPHLLRPHRPLRATRASPSPYAGAQAGQGLATESAASSPARPLNRRFRFRCHSGRRGSPGGRVCPCAGGRSAPEHADRVLRDLAEEIGHAARRPEQRAGPSAATFLDTGGWGYGVGVSEGSTGRRYGWGGGLGTLWYSWPDHDLAAVLVTQVLPPCAELFGAFTNAVESGLGRGR